MSDVLSQATAIVNQADQTLQAQLNDLTQLLASPPARTDSEIIDQVMRSIANLSFCLMGCDDHLKAELRERLLNGTILDEIVCDTNEAPQHRVFQVEVPAAIHRFSAIGLEFRDVALDMLNS